MIYLKVHSTDNGDMIAMCDEALIDKVLSKGEIVIDIKGYSSFYKGDKVDKETAVSRIRDLEHIYSANIVGTDSIDVALSARIIDRKGILFVGDVPYAHSYSMD
ncbi:MAG: DUF424 family protein [Candidatus Marsarchaeota archaeon]|jgi:hypothetical protein|nr:DUF424 family protein [Candidatus Marsarchaeota archaeon]MCL5418502.1 DUF424 family protein [Candidatus Marsarchaeota archaeon]